MSYQYQKATEILPLEIIEEIQKYIDGGIIYIPKKSTNKVAWGTRTKTKQLLFSRNLAIYQDFTDGMNYEELSKKYFLAIKSIQRIIRQMKKQYKYRINAMR